MPKRAVVAVGSEDITRVALVVDDVVVVLRSAVLVFHDAEAQEDCIEQRYFLRVSQYGECLKAFAQEDVLYWYVVEGE
jgi:hypothetical protein